MWCSLEVLVGCRCPHYNFTTTDSSKCPFSPAQKVQSHKDPYFLFSKSQTQLHSLLLARISKDITNINNLWLRAPPGTSIISTFSRTKHLRNPTCPGQTPKTYIRDAKWTWTSRQTNWSRLSCPCAAWCKTKPESSTSGDTNPLHVSSHSHNWPCWAIISPQREVWGVGFTFFLLWGFCHGKDSGKSWWGQLVGGMWDGGSMGTRQPQLHGASKAIWLRPVQEFPMTVGIEAGFSPFCKY